MRPRAADLARRAIACLFALALGAGAASVAAAESWIAFVSGAERLEIAPGDVAEAVLIDTHDGGPALQIRFAPDAAKAFGELTVKVLGERLEVRRGEKVLMAPYVHEPILGGSLRVTGPEAPELKALLDALETAR